MINGSAYGQREIEKIFCSKNFEKKFKVLFNWENFSIWEKSTTISQKQPQVVEIRPFPNSWSLNQWFSEDKPRAFFFLIWENQKFGYFFFQNFVSIKEKFFWKEFLLKVLWWNFGQRKILKTWKSEISSWSIQFLKIIILPRKSSVFQKKMFSKFWHADFLFKERSVEMSREISCPLIFILTWSWSFQDMFKLSL